MQLNCEKCGSQITHKTTYCSCGELNKKRELIVEEKTLRDKQIGAIGIGLISFLIITLIHIFIANSTGNPTDFQRGGALIVFIEFVLFSWVRYYDNKVQSIPWVGGRPTRILDKVSSLFAVILGGIGTIVWGYGDIVFKSLA